MRLVPIPVQAKMDNGLTTLAVCCRITRKDGVVKRFTTFHDDLVVDGGTYKANTAIFPSTLKQTATSAVDNATMSGTLSSVDITVADILAERYDYAEVRMFMVDYLDLPSGPIASVTANFGEIQAKGGAFETELRLLMQRLTQKLIEVTTRDCRAILGDSRCKFPLVPILSTVGSGSTPTRTSFRGVGTSITTMPDGWFAWGKLEWVTGLNAGIVSNVKTSETATGLLEMQRTLRYDVAVGDEFSLVTGCDGRIETCENKFSNVPNFQGEPHIRGVDYMVRTVIR